VPKSLPAVPASTTPAKVILPCAAHYAAGGMTISEGTGMIELSIAISTKTPTYPQFWTQPNQTRINS